MELAAVVVLHVARIEVSATRQVQGAIGQLGHVDGRILRCQIIALRLYQLSAVEHLVGSDWPLFYYDFIVEICSRALVQVVSVGDYLAPAFENVTATAVVLYPPEVLHVLLRNTMTCATANREDTVGLQRLRLLGLVRYKLFGRAQSHLVIDVFIGSLIGPFVNE